MADDQLIGKIVKFPILFLKEKERSIYIRDIERSNSRSRTPVPTCLLDYLTMRRSGHVFAPFSQLAQGDFRMWLDGKEQVRGVFDA